MHIRSRTLSDACWWTYLKVAHSAVKANGVLKVTEVIETIFGVYRVGLYELGEFVSGDAE